MAEIPIYYPAPEAPLAPPELAQVLGAALDGNPKLAAAVRQMLQQRLARATVESSLPKLSEREAGHAGGRLAEITGLQHELAGYVRHAAELRGRTGGKPKPLRP